MADTILVVNSGSTSLKFAIYRADEGAALPLLCRGEIESMDTAAHFALKTAQGEPLDEYRWPAGAPLDHKQALSFVVERLERAEHGMRVAMAGHRVVLGGERYAGPVLATPEVLDHLDDLARLEPSHQRYNVAGARALLESYGHLPQVCCFDTSFHHTMPALATCYALPRSIRDTGVRHWGYHGISYDYISRRMAKIALGARRTIVCHLGGGASMCAMLDGRSIDTTMQFGALSGLPMSTRSGDLPPEAIFYLLRHGGWTLDALEHAAYRQSGLLGLSGISGDMRALQESADPNAAFAIDHFVHAMTKYAGAYTALLQGLDALVFTAGIGEHSPIVRAKLCAKLAWMGIDLDEAANAANDLRISTANSAIGVYVVPTDEERMIAQYTFALAGAA